MKITMLALATLVVGAIAPRMPADPAGALHFALSKSEPEAGSTVHQVSEVKLWFTEEPEEGTVSIRLMDASDEAVETGEPAQDEHDPRIFSVALPNGLPMGTYTVAWRGMGDDGHVVRETFDFTVGH